MLKHCAFFAVIFAGLAILAVSGYAQGQRRSPAANANCSFADGKAVTVAYSSPRAKGRKIYGGLVPYGKVWAQARTKPPRLRSIQT